MEEIEEMEEVCANPLYLLEEKLTEVARVEVPKERELTIEVIGTLTTAEFEETGIKLGEIAMMGTSLKGGTKC